MKTGRTLQELAQEVVRQAEQKRDWIADTRSLQMGDRGDLILDTTGAALSLPMRTLAHQQVADRIEVPRRYYDRMLKEAPALLAENVNHWFKETPERRMIRALDGHVRAFLSDRYRALENIDLAQAILPVLGEMELDVMSAQITEERLYIKAVDRRITRDMPTGRRWGDGSHIFFDTLSPAIVISNSEVGAGSLSIEAGVWTKACTNMAIAASRSMKKYHTGGRAQMGEGIYELLTDETKRATDQAIWMQTRDVVRGAFEKAKFDALVDEMQAMTEDKILGDPIQTVELTSKHFGMSEGEKGNVLRHLIEGGDLSRYGLFNAVTRTAEDLDSYDRATDFERMGGQIIELPRHDWERIAKADKLRVAA